VRSSLAVSFQGSNLAKERDIIKNVKKMFPEYLIYLQERIKEGEMNPGEIIYPPE